MWQFLPALSGLFLAAPAFAATDFSQVPPTFCKAALEVAQETTSCSANSTFMAESQACLDKLNRLEAELGKEAVAVAQGGAAAQRGKMQTGKSEYEFSATAMSYLRAAAQVAAQELADYPWQIFLPADEAAPESIKEILETALGSSCYSEPLKKVNEIRGEFDRKIAMYGARIAEATKHRGTLQSSSKNLDATGAAAAGSRAVGSGAPKGKASGGPSDITGVQQDLDKQRK